MAPLEPWEKVLVDAQAFTATVHGQIACTECHGGTEDAEKETAHTDLIRNPSEPEVGVCSDCHPDVAAAANQSLHATQAGYWTALNARSAPEHKPALEEMFGNHCASCHTTCADCHISQPNSVGGGFIDGHVFQSTPSLTRNCTACHGSRVGSEYLGQHEGLKPDVHFREGRMACVDCHTGQEMHGQEATCDKCHPSPEDDRLPPPQHRYAGLQNPRCETCHPSTTTGTDGIEMHAVHGGDLSCSVCHSVSYASCDGCHVAISEQTGKPFFATDDHYLSFIIGRNPIPSYDRPYRYVTLRHIPISPQSYAYYGQDLLPNYDALPTWMYATPHNTQRETPQTESCNACHGNPALFLTLDKVAPEERAANQSVIMDSIPGPVEEPTEP